MPFFVSAPLVSLLVLLFAQLCSAPHRDTPTACASSFSLLQRHLGNVNMHDPKVKFDVPNGYLPCLEGEQVNNPVICVMLGTKPTLVPKCFYTDEHSAKSMDRIIVEGLYNIIHCGLREGEMIDPASGKFHIPYEHPDESTHGQLYKKQDTTKLLEKRLPSPNHSHTPLQSPTSSSPTLSEMSEHGSTRPTTPEIGEELSGAQGTGGGKP